MFIIKFLQGARRESRGMTGQESNPATLFRLYVDYGRYPEATELLVEYVEAYASVVGFLLIRHYVYLVRS